ncbi:hypothetical protein ACQP0C_12450 [Nocardia sp. CA-129566]|uniref:hypothetical protein n=1 Tax=Nocardia sp. CA-129566 TaxID=3239976 RepID=UPI003D965144
MPIPIQNLIILGDSLSDIGIKREAPTGMFARAIEAMRTNDIGRYSDGRNWTDFLVEWTGADSLLQDNVKTTYDATEPHRSLTRHSLLLRTDTTATTPLRYANYAEGGAIAASDWKPKAGALGYLKTEVGKYIDARRALGDLYTGDTLHIVWIGLNDIVTAERAEGTNMSGAPGGVYEVHISAKEKLQQKAGIDPDAGTGITPIVAEIKEQADRIVNAFPNSRDHEHFLLINLPSPTISVRFKDQIADGKRKLVDRFERNTLRFNEVLEFVTTHWPMTEHDLSLGPGAKPANVGLVGMYEWMRYVADNATAFELTELAQLPGVPVLYRGETDTIRPAIRRCLTTSDLAHPTEAVYELIARKIADDLLAKYTLGHLNAQSWPTVKPYARVG